MSKEKLKACPFCGSEKLGVFSDGGCKDFSVSCGNCPAIMTIYGFDSSEEQIIKAWNTRAVTERESELLDALEDCYEYLRQVCPEDKEWWESCEKALSQYQRTEEVKWRVKE